jgi:hypothetical protein
MTPALVGGVTAAMAMANLTAALGGCPHPNAVPVELLDDGQRVAVLCPDCDTQLPAEWRTAEEGAALERAKAAAVLIGAGFDPADALEVTGGE